MFTALTLALLQVVPSAARGPAYASDGRLAVSVDGDLAVQRGSGTSGRWTRVTNGPAWDRSPAWTRDGTSLVFVSDRAGGLDLYRLRLGGNGAAQPERLTQDAAPDDEPALAPDGRIVFVRGRGPDARLWIRASDGAEKKLTTGNSPERWPAISSDGKYLAYVQLVESGRRLRVRDLASNADSIIVADRAPEHPAWSPDGERVVFASSTPRAGVYVTPRDGRYVNLVSARRGEPAWSPDARTIAIAPIEADEPSYNGDPERGIDRSASELLSAANLLLVVAAPVAPDAGRVEVTLDAEGNRSRRNAEVFDRTWLRVDSLYFTSADARPRRAEWQRARETHRPRALSAANDRELERQLHTMLSDRPPLRAEARGRAVVSSAHPVSTAAGLEILTKGGNVVDAAVAVSFALGVVEPDASGIGGYGEMLVSLRGMSEPALFEFMSRVPEEATLANAALQQDGRYPSDGPILAMVPGTVAGMHAAWKKHGSGKVTWADVVAPAIKAARDGYVVSDGLATTLAREKEGFLKYEGSRALFFRDGKPIAAGDTIKNPDLAWTLERIAKDGADGFYKGEVASRLVSDLRGKGSAMRTTDLARYFAAEREAVQGTYRDYTIFSSAPPVGGGATLVAQLNLLEQYPAPKPYPDDAATLHAMIAAWQLVPSSRGRVADPSLWPVNLEPITNRDTARARWRCFDAERALSPRIFRGDSLVCGTPPSAGTPDRDEARELEWPREECADDVHATGAICRAQGTTAFAVADADGNLVAVTQTLGTWGGNFYVTPGLGFLYNDKLTSYGTDPNGYGARLPFARHGSTLAPTIVYRGRGADRRPLLALGAAGNAWITSAVYQSLVGMLDFGLRPQRALELPRFLPSGRGGQGAQRETVIDHEDGWSPDVMARLRQMGYRLNPISLRGELRMGYGAAVMIDGAQAVAGADPRRSGSAGAVP